MAEEIQPQDEETTPAAGSEGEGEEPKTPDYKSELERERKKLDLAGKKIEQERAKRLELQNKLKGLENPEIEEDKPLTQKDLESFRNQIIQDTKKEGNRNAVVSRIRQLAINQEEAELGIIQYDNYFVSTGDIEEDAQKCLSAANWKSRRTEREEMLKTLASKETRESTTGSPQESKPKNPDSQPSDAANQIIRGAFSGDPQSEEIARKGVIQKKKQAS